MPYVPMVVEQSDRGERAYDIYRENYSAAAPATAFCQYIPLPCGEREQTKR